MEESDVGMIDYLNVAWKWKWLILAGTVAAALAVFVMSVTARRTYEATATLLVTESRIPRPEDIFDSMIRNQSLALQAVQQFGLDGEPSATPPTQFLANSISIRALRGTNLITLTASLPDPKLAAAVANFAAEKALELNASLKQTNPVSARDHIGRQRDDAKKAVDNAQAALANFKRTASLERLHNEQEILLTEGKRLAQLYSDYTIQMKGLQAAVSELRRVLTKQESPLATAQERGATDPKTPSPMQLKSQELNAVSQVVQSNLIEKEVALASLETQREEIERRIKENEVRLSAIERKILDGDVQLEKLTRNYDWAKYSYEIFARAFDNAALAVAPGLAEVKVVSPAVTPTAPRGRQVIRRVALAATAAFAVLATLACFLEYLQQTTRRRKKLVGVIPS